MKKLSIIRRESDIRSDYDKQLFELQIKMFEKEIQALREAVDVYRKTNDDWRANANEWRGQSKDREGAYLTRKEFWTGVGIFISVVSVASYIFVNYLSK